MTGQISHIHHRQNTALLHKTTTPVATAGGLEAMACEKSMCY